MFKELISRLTMSYIKPAFQYQKKGVKGPSTVNLYIDYYNQKWLAEGRWSMREKHVD